MDDGSTGRDQSASSHETGQDNKSSGRQVKASGIREESLDDGIVPDEPVLREVDTKEISPDEDQI